MKRCELMEVEVSALADGELGAAQTLRTVDHVLGCPSCSEFYRQARDLDATLSEVCARAKAEDLPPGLWDRILESSEPGVYSRRSSRWSRPMFGTLAKVAAAMLIVISTWTLARVIPQPVSDGLLDGVVAEQSGGAMDEDRFVRMTTELLRSDAQYQRAMLEIMTTVNSRRMYAEGTADRAVPALMTENTGRWVAGEVGSNPVETDQVY